MNTYLDKLELHGFKSFPEKTIIKFHKGITAIIGPNGCGKSNIVDAVLWVLGEQKIKSLRGENNEDLIFNGSADKKPLGMTEVGAYFIKDYEPVHIARRYYRSSETKYILNQKYSRNKDIQSALYDMQMGEKKYFIFEQGSIDKLVSLKAGEKRVLIEEAAGVSQYLERKKETVNKLIIAEQNLESLDMLIFDKEKRLKELKNQVNYVQRYRTYKIEKTNNLKALIEKKYSTIQVEVKKNLFIKDERIKKELLLSKELIAIEKTILKLEEEKWAIDLEQKRFDEIKFNTSSLLISTQKEIEKFKQQQVFTSQSQKDIEKNINNDIRENELIEPELVKLRKSLASLNLQLHAEISEQKATKTIISELNSELIKFKNENNGFKSEIFKIQSQISTEKNRLNKLERTKFSNENEIKNKSKYMKEILNTNLINQIEIKQKELQNLKNNLLKITKELDKFKSTQNILKLNIDKNKNKINEIENEILSLNKQKEKYIEIKNKISGHLNITDILREKPLQDILKTEKIYYKSIENYFFDEMDSTFSDINKIPDNKNKYILTHKNKHKIPDNLKNEITKEKGFISFISDIYILEEIKHKQSLKDGIIVQNLSCGIDIFLKYGFGIITKNSEIITSNGLIIKDRDKGILNINHEISEVESKVKTLSQNLNDIYTIYNKEKEMYDKLLSSIQKEQQLLKICEKDIYQKKSDLSSIKENEIRNKKRLEIIKKELLIIKQDNEELSKELNLSEDKEIKLKENEKKLIKENEKFKLNLEKKKDRINEIEKKNLKQQSSIYLIQEKTKSIESQISSLKDNKNRLTVQSKNNQNKLQELSDLNKETENKINSLKKELKATNTELDKNNILSQDIALKSNLVNEKLKKSNINLKKLRIEINEIKETKGEVEIILTSFKNDVFRLEDIALKELNDEIRNIKGSEDYLSKELTHLEEEVANFEDKLNKMRDSEKLNFSAESEYEMLFGEHGFLITQKEDVIDSIKDMHEVIEKIDSQSKISFLKAFNEIKESFVENFKILFEGGDATLTLTDQGNLLETGLNIKAQPPGKQLLSLRLLSGGEKTLTSLAFLFALFQYKPAPFCIFDEVDASLDEANIQRFLKFLHILKANTQFLIITHNFKTMEEADYLYGISMNEPGISTIYSTKFSDT